MTGATGYVGGRLVPRLLAAGYAVRCLARRPAKIAERPWADDVETAEGDIADPDAVDAALRDVDVAYYLVHGLGRGDDFEAADRHAARLFGDRARAAGVRRIVYLGALTPAGIPNDRLSPHLRSRAEVGRILLASGVPTAVLRAAVVIGSGSASFEMLRQLTERLPVMVTPRWVRTRLQPIAVDDVLRLLVGCAELPDDVNRGFDVGGPDVLTYRDMMRAYAAASGLRRRLIVPVPVLTPHLSGLWIRLVTSVPPGLARPLIESLRHEVVCQERDITAYVPDPPGGPATFRRALTLSLRRVRGGQVPGRRVVAAPPWTGPADPLPTDPGWSGGSLYTDVRERPVAAPPAALWRVVERIGGDNGWYSAQLAWVARGWLDRLVGGVGLRRGRPDPERLRVGDQVDFWRVEVVEPGRLLRLRAEMRLPGLAWLELRVDEDAAAGGSRYRQRALFHPRGLAGHAYWWAISPFHAAVFGGMARTIARTAASGGSAASPDRAGGPVGKERRRPGRGGPGGGH
ncbi:SDR family oxidoreductase [Streptomyces sp. B6B3]|uniref:SDR family oxidoreductase n=1 Tax=Streptomyces sp. B6B3 TaxID=3153570 RepID=UPI00325CCD58